VIPVAHDVANLVSPRGLSSHKVENTKSIKYRSSHKPLIFKVLRKWFNNQEEPGLLSFGIKNALWAVMP
jgi:hypothetical protein